MNKKKKVQPEWESVEQLELLLIARGFSKENAGNIVSAIRALKQVSFYANVNHGTKAKDYGEVVDPVLRALGVKTGEL